MYRKAYLVVGGSSGIGLAVCKKLAEEGCRIAIISSSAAKLQTAMKQLPGDGHVCFPYDLDDVTHIESIFQFIAQQDILLHGMVYCAGVSPLQLLADNDYQLAEKVYRINVLSYIECARCFYNPHYSIEGSKIVGVASVTAHGSGYRQTLYGSSKAAMIAASRLMAKELMNRQIRINCISPGCTDTDLLSSLYRDAEKRDSRVRSIQPLGTIPVEYVADAILFLLSSSSDYLTGTELMYDAGFCL